MVKAISVLGCTGSIGRQTLQVAEHLGIRVAALTANRKIDMLEQQARKFRPSFVAVFDEEAAKRLRIALADTDIQIASGMEGLVAAASLEGADCVVTAVSGSVGLRPTLAAIDTGKRIALANKETLVCAGKLVMARAKKMGAEIVPVDSEHSAIFQCLIGRSDAELGKILLTGSGGPFRGMKRDDLEHVTPAQAVAHPNWSMGAKISVDSSTLMNKGLEFIEAMHLFHVCSDDIQVVIHPQSIVHSMVELVDGTVIAQLGPADMGLPIQFALTYPDRRPSVFEHLDFWRMKDLTFREPDLVNFPCLRLAMDCASRGGTAACVMSAANEVAVHKFLREELGYNQIYDAAASAVEALAGNEAEDLETILEADRSARVFVNEHF